MLRKIANDSCLMIRIPLAFKEKIENAARCQGVTVSEYVREVLAAEFADQQVYQESQSQKATISELKALVKKL